VASLATCLIATAPVVAQVLTVQNLAPHAREEWAHAVVPFARGQAPRIPDLHVRDRATVWQPFGARWDDGSIRQASCLFRLRLEPLSETTVELVPGPGPAVAPAAPALPAATLAIGVRQGDRVRTVQPRPVALLERNAARVVARLAARLADSGLVCELILAAYAGQEHADLDVAVFHSDPGTPALECAIDELWLDCAGAAWLPRHADTFGIDHRAGEAGSRSVLLRDTVLGDGQGIRRTGVLVPRLEGKDALRDATLRAAAVCPMLAAASWTASGAFGPFGHLPDPPAGAAAAALRGALAARHRAFARAGGPRDPFVVGPLGLTKNPGQTGDQADFGVRKLAPIAASGVPSFLLEVEWNVLQEGCRPVHFFEADATPVLSRNHPEWVVWSGRTHWHGDVSKDRLGKPVPVPPFESHGWFGKDREHWSTNLIGAHALLTGAHWARLELANEVQLFLAGETLDPRLSTSHVGPARGAGRTLLAGCWLWLVTGDDELRQRMVERVERVCRPEWGGKDVPPGKVRAFGVCDPDPRMLDGKTPYWNPWQDALAVVGFAAVHRLTGNATALELADEVALTVLRFGWKLEGPDAPIVATAIRWNDGGEPPTDEQLRSGAKEFVVWSHGTDFSLWSIGAVAWGREAAQRAGDAALVERAERILAQLRASRQARDPLADRLLDWDGVR
jgi:hypothetical protein